MKAGREATVLAKLSHPNIVGFFESFLHGPSYDTLCIVMDYADGGDLMSVLNRRNGRLLDEEVVLSTGERRKGVVYKWEQRVCIDAML